MNAPTPPETTPGRARGLALAAVSVALVAALAAAVVGGVLWARADTQTNGLVTVERSADGASAAPTATERQAFLLDAGQAAVYLTSVTPDDTDTMIANIEGVSAGALADEFSDPAMKDELVKDVIAQGVTRTSRVVSITPSAFDPAAGTASALVFLVQDLSDGQSTGVRRMGVTMDMKLVDGVWRAVLIGPLFVGEGAAPGADAAQPSNAQPSNAQPPTSPSAGNPAGD